MSHTLNRNDSLAVYTPVEEAIVTEKGWREGEERLQ